MKHAVAYGRAFRKNAGTVSAVSAFFVEEKHSAPNGKEFQNISPSAYAGVDPVARFSLHASAHC